MRDIVDLKKLNNAPVAATSFTDGMVQLLKQDPQAGEYKFHVFAYIVHAVNRLGVRSGPSPFGLTIPSGPTGVMNREEGSMANLRWEASPEKASEGIVSTN